MALSVYSDSSTDPSSIYRNNTVLNSFTITYPIKTLSSTSRSLSILSDSSGDTPVYRLAQVPLNTNAKTGSNEFLGRNDLIQIWSIGS